MASNVIDYFATLGRKTLNCKSFESLWVNDKLRSPSEIWNEAITDIAIVHEGEKLPDDTWQTIDQSIDHRPISSRSTIAVRRRGASKRLDHITKVRVAVDRKTQKTIMLSTYTEDNLRCHFSPTPDQTN